MEVISTFIVSGILYYIVKNGNKAACVIPEDELARMVKDTPRRYEVAV